MLNFAWWVKLIFLHLNNELSHMAIDKRKHKQQVILVPNIKLLRANKIHSIPASTFS